VLHQHPVDFPGGAEAYALELYEAMKESPDFEPILVARMGPSVSKPRFSHPRTPFGNLNGDPNQHYVYTEVGPGFDEFFITARDKSLYTRHFTSFLRARRPDIVHFQ